jgi:hypothetical protein
MMTGLRKASAGVALAIVLAAAPAWAGQAKYTGKTAQGPKVTFSATSKKVRDFKTSATVVCVSVATGRSVQEIHPVMLSGPAPVKKHRFQMVFDGPSSTLITVTGRFKDSRASGTLKVRYNKIIGSSPTGLDIAACVADANWTAKAK